MAEVVEEEEPQGSGCAGAVVITAAVLAVLGGAYALSPTCFVLGVMGGGWAAVIWATGWRPKWMRRTANRTPPAPSGRGPEEEPQVTMVRDTAHPNRWIVARPSTWMRRQVNKEAGTT